ncbi:hypothetical protein AA0X95_04800 [Bacillus sp. 1P10SD]
MLKLVRRGVGFFLEAHDVSVADYPRNTKMILGEPLQPFYSLLD